MGRFLLRNFYYDLQEFYFKVQEKDDYMDARRVEEDDDDRESIVGYRFDRFKQKVEEDFKDKGQKQKVQKKKKLELFFKWKVLGMEEYQES